MIRHTVEHGQTIFDICKYYFLSLDKLDILLKDNQLSINDTLFSGQIILVRQSEIPINNNLYKSSHSINSTTFSAVRNRTEAEPNYADRIQFQGDESPDIFIVEHGQSVFDVARTVYGNQDSGLSILLKDNNLTISSYLESGQRMKVRPELLDKKFIINKSGYLTATIHYDPIALENLVVQHETDTNKGSIVYDVVGGKAPYKFYWSNGETTQNIFNLSKGIYSLKIIDFRGATFEKVFNLEYTDTNIYITDHLGNYLLTSAGQRIKIR